MQEVKTWLPEDQELFSLRNEARSSYVESLYVKVRPCLVLTCTILYLLYSYHPVPNAWTGLLAKTRARMFAKRTSEAARRSGPEFVLMAAAWQRSS